MIPIRVVAFARVRELLGYSERELTMPPGSTVGALRERLEADAPELVALRASTRIAKNGRLVDDTTALVQGDEVALLPPVGGG